MSRLKRSLAMVLAFVIALCSSVTEASAETKDVMTPWYPMPRKTFRNPFRTF